MRLSTGFVWGAGLVWGCAAAASGPVTLTDIFQMENVAGAAFDPSGKRIVFERIPPYDKRSNYGLALQQTAELFVYEPSGTAPAHALIADSTVASLGGKLEGMWMGAFSPKGTRLAVYFIQDGEAKAGVYDFSLQRFVAFSFTPDIQFGADSLVWLSEDELVYTALPAGHQPPVPDWRRVAARHLAREWEKAWAGKESTASVLSSRAGEPDRTMQPGSLLRVNASTGLSKVIGEGRFSAFSLSPDSRYLVAFQAGQLRQLNADKPLDSADNHEGTSKEAKLFDLTHAAAPLSLLAKGEALESTVAWSAHSDKIAFYASNRGGDASGIYYLFDVRSRSAKPMPHVGLDLASQRERGWQSLPDLAVPFDRGIAFPARAQKDAKAPPAFTPKDVFPTGLSRVDWYEITADGRLRNLTAGMSDVSSLLVSASGDGIVVNADGGLWRLEPGGRRTRLTPGLPFKLRYSRPFKPEGGELVDVSASVVVAKALIAGAPETPWYIATDAPYVFVDLKNKHSTTLAVPAKAGRVLTVSSSAEAAIVRNSSDTDWSLAIASREKPAPAQFWTFNRHLSEIKQPRKVTLSYTLADGKKVQCEAILPADYIAGRRAPTVVSIYPNVAHYSSGSQYGFVNPYDDALFATMGYIVLYPYSSEPELRDAESPLANWGAMVTPAMDELVKEGYADPDRFSTYGISQGSWSVLALLTETQRFKAAMAGFGAANFVSHYGALGIERRIWTDDLFAMGSALRYEMTAGTYPLIGSALVDDPMRFVRASPLFGAKKINTPLLLMHTDLDVNFPMEQFDEMFTQMMRWHKEAQYVRYWGEEHGVTSPANIRDQWSRMLAWFDRWSDISRDTHGQILYDSEQVRSRGGGAALSNENFLRLGWFFGTDAAPVSKQR
jgi:hypothetical protein